MNFTYNPNQIAYFHSDNNLLAEVTFPNVDADTVDINHTFVDDSLRGQGVAGKLMEAVADHIRSQGKKQFLPVLMQLHGLKSTRNIRMC